MGNNTDFWVKSIDEIKVILYDLKKLLSEIDDAWVKIDEIEEKIAKGMYYYGKIR